MLNKRYVEGSGPLSGALLWLVGEAPGHTEERHGAPFMGRTGDVVRSEIRQGGLDPEFDVRYDNVCRYNIKIPEDAAAKAAIIEKYSEHLAMDRARIGTGAVIVPCGALALQYFTGRTNMGASTGAVIQEESGQLIIPVLHPAAAMHKSKLQPERLTVAKGIRRACAYAQGQEYVAPAPTFELNPSPERLEQVLAGADYMVIDTEFVPDEKRTHMIGLNTNLMQADESLILLPEGMMIAHYDVLRKHLLRSDLTKVAHFHYADVNALSWLGFDTVAPWFDTLTVFATLYPDLPANLSYVSRFYLDNVDDWKWMSTEDPRYLALDVYNTRRIFEAEREDLTDSDMWGVVEDEVIPALPLLYGLQERGLQVDKLKLTGERKKLKREIKEKEKEIKADVGEIFEKRREPLKEVIAYNERLIEAMEGEQLLGDEECCPIHEFYQGLRKKNFSKASECQCSSIFEHFLAGQQRERLAGLRKEITAAKTKLKRWEKGFDPGNNDHVRWLLYNKDALGLPPQKDPKSKRITASATAVARLISLKTVAKKKGAIELLQKIKRVQHLEKYNSTFYFGGKLKLPKSGIVHPAYRMVTGTGRPASGDDVDLHEKGISPYKFNALNIPHECRVIYVPKRPANDPVFINVDWVNLEGRLTAHFSGDETLQQWLDAELQGEHKVHARTAGMLYGIDPGDSKKHMVSLQGNETAAYNGGKRLRHGWHYGMKERKMAQTFWIPLTEAERVNRVLTELHPRIPEWWQELSHEIFGIPSYCCPRCQGVFNTPGTCQACGTLPGGIMPRLEWAGWEQYPTKLLRTPFGRRRLYLGRRSDGLNAAISQKPQSSGASMWYRSLGRLSGIDVGGDVWPVPPGTRVFTGSYGQLIEARNEDTNDVETGTYDSFLVQTTGAMLESVLEWVLWTCEQAWPELGGLRIPAEPSIGYNWGDFDDKNPDGLNDKAVEYTQFTAGCPAW